MTFREKLAKEHPECIDERCGGGVLGCPCNGEYGYEKDYWCGDGTGYGKKCSECWDREIPTEKTYEEGLKDAWELAKKIALAPSLIETANIFIAKNISGIEQRRLFEQVFALTPQEALAKLKAYEEEKEIKVGDVVYDTSVIVAEDEREYAIVTNIYATHYEVLMKCGDTSSMRKGECKKTGQHLDIESLLGQIRGE